MGYLSCNADSAIAVCDPSSYYNKTKKKHKTPQKIRRFAYSDLESATNNFSPHNILGKGSHGTVYKAILDDGKLIAAVKKTTNSNFITTNLHTNNTTTTSAENEIEILSKIHSSRIVNLIGYAIQHSTTTDDHKNKNTNLLLVVEYMPNSSLYDILHKTPPNSIPPPTLTFRIRAALQVAKSLHTLHTSTPPIIHRDVKSSNILLTANHNARLSDFGLALRGQIEDVHILSTPPAGTLGYLDPTYLSPSDLTTKSDVFSYGILLLEIISGRRAIDVNYSPPSVIDWAIPLIKDGKFSEICDRRIRCLGNEVVVIKELGLLVLRCVRSTARKRVSMGEVVDCLKVIYKWVKVPAVWSNLKWRVRDEGKERVGRVDADDKKNDDEERVTTAQVGAEEWARNSRFGGKRSLTGRNKKKVSSVSSLEEIIKTSSSTTTRDRDGGRDRIVGRSRSAGSYNEIITTTIQSGGNGKIINSEDDVGSKSNYRHHKVSLTIKGRKSGEVSVRVSTSRAKLSKSRSMSVLYGGSSKDKKDITVRNINGAQVRNSINITGSSGGQVKSPSIKEELDELPLLETSTNK